MCSGLQCNTCVGLCVILVCVGIFRNPFPVHTQLLPGSRDGTREGKAAAPPHSYHRRWLISYISFIALFPALEMPLVLEIPQLL